MNKDKNQFQRTLPHWCWVSVVVKFASLALLKFENKKCIYFVLLKYFSGSFNISPVMTSSLLIDLCCNGTYGLWNN